MMKRILFWGVLLAAIIAILELGGYIGIRVLDKKNVLSELIELPEPVRPDWYGKPFTRLREILTEKKDCHPRYYSSFNLNYANYPGFIDHDVIQNNEDAYRGEKINCTKGNKFRILFLGGSTTYGMVRYPDQTFPAQTGKILNEEIKNFSTRWTEVEIINAGIIGGLLSDELHNYIYKYRYYKPDLVVIHSGGNDGFFDMSDSWLDPDYANSRSFDFWEIEKVVPAWAMRSWFVSFLVMEFYYLPHDVDLERASSVSNVKTLTHWFPDTLKEKIKNGDKSFNPFYNNFSTLVRQIQADSSSVLVMPFPLDPNPKYDTFYSQHHNPYYKNMISYNQMMRDVSLKYHTGWVDYKYESVDAKYWFDPMHLLAEGEKQKARLVANQIEEILKKSK